MHENERLVHDAELRFVNATEGQAGAGTLSGYAAVFNALSVELGPPSKRFREIIAPGAFRAALESVVQGRDNVYALWNHDELGMPLGSTRDGSLRLQEDGRGLAFELDLPDTTAGRDLAALARRGTVRGVSFGFPTRSVKDTWHSDGGVMVRTLHEVRTLIDVSPTHIPAYPDTALAVRSLEQWRAQEDAEAERRRRKLKLAEIS